MSCFSLAFIAALFAVHALVPVAAQTDPEAAATAELHIVFDDGLLSVDARDAELQAVLEEVAAQSGLALSIRGSLRDNMTIAFTGLALTTAIDRLLHGRSFALQYDSGSPSLPSRLWVMSASNSRAETDARGADAVPGLARRNSSAMASRERLEAVSAMSDRETDTFAFELAPALADESPAVRLEAVHALGEIGDDTSTGFLQQLLFDPDVDVRAAAIDALAEAGGELSALTLSAVLRDPDPALRENAVYALGEIGGPRAMELLNQATSDSDESVRQVADEVLRELDDQQ